MLAERGILRVIPHPLKAHRGPEQVSGYMLQDPVIIRWDRFADEHIEPGMPPRAYQVDAFGAQQFPFRAVRRHVVVSVAQWYTCLAHSPIGPL